MAFRTYIRPLGPLPPARAGFPSPGYGLCLAGGPCFAAAELIERHPDDRIERRVVSAGELRALAAQTTPDGLAANRLIDRLAAPRSAVAGLSPERPLIMGVVNVTPDSFSDGGRFLVTENAIAHGLRLAEEGADILDIGGESTRPGAAPITFDEELRRVIPVIEGLAAKTKTKLSVDTRNAEVMRRAAAAGVHLINDVSALAHDTASPAAAAASRLPVVLMHAQGSPETMQRDPQYKDALLDVFDYLEARIAACEQAGIPRERLIVDPGIGFGKTVEHNLQILAGLSLFHTLGVPVLLGVSRKRFIGTLTGANEPAVRVPGSIAAALTGVMQGVQLLRVHDVAAMRQALTVWEAAFAGRSPAA